MSYCGPRNAVPSCPAIPTVGFGSSSCGFDNGFGCGGYGIGSGGTTSAASLGVLRGAHPRCVVQLRSQEATIQPPPVVVTIPGPILSSTPVPLGIGAYAPCAGSGSGSGFGSGICNPGLGYGNLVSGISHSGSRGFLGSCDNIGLNPCYDVCH